MTSFKARGPKRAVGGIAALVGMTSAALVGVAVAGTLTLQVAKHASVTNQVGATKHEAIVVSSRGFAVYELTGDSLQHPKCTSANSCFSFWPPAKASSAKRLTKAPGIRGKLGIWHRDGFFQLTLGGHPLYTYAADLQKDNATGQGVQTFGGTWHVVPASGSSAAASSGSSSSSSASSSGIPQGANAGDRDSDNHGARSDGDDNR